MSYVNIMCGIFSLLNNNNRFSSEHVVDAFNEGKNRGPENSHISAFGDKLVMGFHRLAINGLDNESMQPITIGSCTLICNGEIYNYKELFKQLNISPHTNSDCEIIIHLYIKYGIEHAVTLLDGVFAFILLDNNNMEKPPVLHICRDPFGVRPLSVMQREIYDEDTENIFAFASDVKVLSRLLYGEESTSDDDVSIVKNNNIYSPLYKNRDEYNNEYIIHHIQPGTIQSFSCDFKIRSQWKSIMNETPYYNIGYTKDTFRDSKTFNYEQQSIAWKGICYNLNQAIKKRVLGTSDRPIACLLSGGLDSSLVTALVNKYYDGILETFSIGMKGSVDLKRAKEVSEYLGTKHTSIELTKEEFFNAIPYVIYDIESYDTTTVRASVGNYLIGKYISENSDAKVIFNGDGSDELTGGYLYFLSAPNNMEFDFECRRLLKNISTFDVLRSDKCISSHGLEPRTPFLDKQFVDYYLGIPVTLRNPLSEFHNNAGTIPVEKLLLRQAFDAIEPNLLPKHILWRTKEAFSDGVSGDEGVWFKLINEMVMEEMQDEKYGEKYHNIGKKSKQFIYNKPVTSEQFYYRTIFESYFPNMANIIPYFWMPKFVDASDSSATTLHHYNPGC